MINPNLLLNPIEQKIHEIYEKKLLALHDNVSNKYGSIIFKLFYLLIAIVVTYIIFVILSNINNKEFLMEYTKLSKKDNFSNQIETIESDNSVLYLIKMAKNIFIIFNSLLILYFLFTLYRLSNIIINQYLYYLIELKYFPHNHKDSVNFNREKLFFKNKIKIYMSNLINFILFIHISIINTNSMLTIDTKPNVLVINYHDESTQIIIIISLLIAVLCSLWNMLQYKNIPNNSFPFSNIIISAIVLLMLNIFVIRTIDQIFYGINAFKSYLYQIKNIIKYGMCFILFLLDCIFIILILQVANNKYKKKKYII